MATISFVIPAYDEERLLRRTLVAVHGAARALGWPYEIVAADDGSADATVAVARAGGARVIEVRYRQIARVRNAGARAAGGDVLVFVDADTVVSASVLRATVAALGHGAAGGGAPVAFDGRIPPYARLLLPLFRALMRSAGLAAGCYVFCTRAAFDAVGGFDERLYAAEEIAFSRALRRQGRVVILREPVVTSGRKLRTYSGWEVLRLFLDLVCRGTTSVRSRTHLSLWYGARRDDPGPI